MNYCNNCGSVEIRNTYDNLEKECVDCANTWKKGKEN